MFEITWVEILLAGWLFATLALSIGFCWVRYGKLNEPGAGVFEERDGGLSLRTP